MTSTILQVINVYILARYPHIAIISTINCTDNYQSQLQDLFTMKQTISVLLALAFGGPASAQIKPPTPGTGTCPEACVPITTGAGALLVCCGTETGCVDCAPSCIAHCGNGAGGGCTNLGGSVEETCSKGCELLCGGTVSILEGEERRFESSVKQTNDSI